MHRTSVCVIVYVNRSHTQIAIRVACTIYACDRVAQRMINTYTGAMEQRDKAGSVSSESVHDGQTLGVFYEEQLEKDCYLVAAIFYSFEGAGGPLEQRIWRQQRRLSPKQRREIVESFDFYPKQAFQDEDRRRIPWGRLSVEAKAVKTSVEDVNELKPPSSDIIERAARGHDLAGFRSIRDFMAHGELLQATHAYLLAVANRSLTPTQDVADYLGVDNQRAKNLVQRARRAGYFDSESNLPTPAALALAEKYWSLGEGRR